MDDDLTWADLLTARDVAELVLLIDALAPEWLTQVAPIVRRDTREMALGFSITGRAEMLLLPLQSVAEAWCTDDPEVVCGVIFDVLRGRLS